MPDLVGGRYPVYDPMWLILGKPTNAAQSDIAVRSNLWATKYGTVAAGALAITEVACVVAVPVMEGDMFTKITYLITKTGKEDEAGYAALYAGKKSGALLAQSKSKKYGAEIAAGKAFTFELESSVLITSSNAPGGWVYVALVIESPTGVAGEIPEVVSVPVPKACQAEWFTGCPEVWSGTAGTGLKTAAEATLGTLTSKAVAPLVFLQ